MFAAFEFPDPGGRGFANAELANIEMKTKITNRKKFIGNL